MGDPDIQIPKGRIISRRTPRSIASIAYGALAFLFVAATGASYFNASNSAFVINIVLTAGLFFIVLGFDRIARSKTPFWRVVGNTLLSTVLTAVAILFITILYYIPTGKPPALNSWFRPGFKVEQPKDVNFSSTSISWIATALADEPKADVQDRFARYRSDVVGLGPQVVSKTVSWDPNVSDNTTIEIALRKKGEPEFRVLAPDVQVQSGSYQITGLPRGSVYEARIVAYQQGVRSEPVIKCSGVAADETLLDEQPLFPGYLIYYTGDIGCNGKLNGAAKLTYERVSYRDMLAKKYSIVPRWIFSGQVKDNRPAGVGKLMADENECLHSAGCRSTCKGTFEQENVADGECRMEFTGLILNSKGLSNDGIGTIYNGGEYLGQVGEENGPHVYIGPFKTTFEGPGVLQARDTDYSALYVGPWEGGRLGMAGRFVDNTDAGNLSRYKVDLLLNGWTIDQNDCQFSADSGKQKNGHQRVFLDCLWIAVSSTKGGFSLRRSDDGKGFIGSLRIDGEEFDMKTTYPSDESLCFHADEFNVGEKVASTDWELNCDALNRSCSLENLAATIEYKANYPMGASPRLQVFAKNGDISKAMINGIPLQPWTSNPEDEVSITLGALITLSRMCGGGEISMSNLKETVSDPCRIAAVMFARLMQCDIRLR
ncbi:hypothetical protein [Mesorhizobium sp. M0496]|uniref:hypothetical protein n=1 Tax=Mesorhizobium sp. M0496 TaxID=2956952 RepID=UPI00333BC48C